MPFSRFARKEIDTVRGKIEDANKEVTPGRVVAELSFGFWCSLMDSYYENLWPPIIKDVFSQAPKASRRRTSLNYRFNKIRKLRNRVFHHERIIHFRDLKNQHDEILEAIGWMSMEMQEMAIALDRFDEIYDAGIDPFKLKIKDHWPVEPLTDEVTKQ